MTGPDAVNEMDLCLWAFRIEAAIAAVGTVIFALSDTIVAALIAGGMTVFNSGLLWWLQQREQHEWERRKPAPRRRRKPAK